MHQILEDGRRQAALSIGQLWWSYLALGGTASPTGLAAFLSGALRPDTQQYDLIAQALNDHLTDLGKDQPVPYSSGR